MLDKIHMGQYTDTLNVSDLLNSSKYIIPLYQRNFAWEANEIEQLLRDVFENNNEHYYIGTLVVSNLLLSGKYYEEVIDGQQRLTALNIIYSVLTHILSCKQKFELNLSFESREKSNSALQLLRERGSLDVANDGSLDNFIVAIRTVEKFCTEVLLNKRGKIEDYFERFLKVKIFKVRLNEYTDKNHYFEVMNNRGEQLESHEIVKAKFMDKLSDETDRKVFATVWDACSNINGRLEKDDTVKSLWGEHFESDPLELDTFEKIKNRLIDKDLSGSESAKYSISTIGNYHLSKDNPQEDRPQDRLEEEYYSVINFPNFLLQVLKIGEFKDNVRMDAAKFLLDEFGCVGEPSLPDTKTFLVKLLRIRVLFDKFIIKRRKTDKTARGWKWVIESPKYENGKLYPVNTFDNKPSDCEDTEDFNTQSKRICMIQAMFFVTFRRDVYMRWLTKALENVNEEPSGSKLFQTLEDYSVWFIKNSRESDGVETNEYKKGLATHHFIFNFLDYQLWTMYYFKINQMPSKDLENYPELNNMFDRTGVREGFKYFVFTRRNSIEHYLAQEKGAYHNISKEVIDDFGNLALISGGLNSKLSNRDCSEKKEYHDPKNPASLKYELMLSEPEWNADKIKFYGKLMASILIDKSDNYFEPYDN